MRHIMVLNPKGGSGKTTLATNLAAYYAGEGENVVLADFDPQRSSMDWLERRPADQPEIRGLPAYEEGLKAMGQPDMVIMDAPAGARGPELTDLLRRVETLLIPVLPSPVDMEASTRFVKELRNHARYGKLKAALVGNRAKDHTRITAALYRFLEKQRVPYIGALRDTQNYVRAFDRGLGVWEMAPYMSYKDWQQWDPIIEWLDSARSRP
ncbi:chromosome partitioning protein [Natronospira proteinivora]|uniref:Chromosome partitioning protein n=1 Tax=Natronospira proteinivora TaxID=1807133 RepID=A0ABT1GCX1_9GAMM|nr:ParA family protein [Natronospira proteinivora]MCP1728123.1 chromosome partitioning protein [Natronospira proteinivora]